MNQNLNRIAERLKARGIELIVLVAPDKFDLYSPYIKTANRYTKALFFETFNQLDKKYLYFDSRSLLRDALSKGQKDVYLYDDTHWSPVGAEIIASKLEKITRKP